MKKILTICVLILALAMSIMFVACGGDKSDNSGTPGNPDNPDNPGGGNAPPISVSNELEWAATIAVIKLGGNNKSYTINVTDSFEITGSTETSPYFPPTFGSGEFITVNVKGETGNENISVKAGTKAIIFKIDAKQNVIINNINLIGNENNQRPLVEVDSTSAYFTMTGTASISGNNSDYNYGGGVCSKGTFTMQDNASIHDNKCTSEGGGVTITDGTFTMKGNASVYKNTTRDGGGGVYVAYGGNFTMQDNAEIYGNTSTYSSNGGGGVLVRKGTFTMKGNVKIYNNAAQGGRGGGVSSVPSGSNEVSSFIMEGGEIYGNNTTRLYGGDDNKGGGVSIGGDSGTATFRIVNGTIYGSDATDANRKNTVQSGGEGDALYIAVTGTTVQPATLVTTDNTVKVANGVIVP